MSEEHFNSKSAVIGKKMSSQKHKRVAKSQRHSNRPREPEQKMKNFDDFNVDRLPAIESENRMINVKLATASSFKEDDKPEETLSPGSFRQVDTRQAERAPSLLSYYHLTLYHLAKP